MRDVELLASRKWLYGIFVDRDSLLCFCIDDRMDYR